MFPRLAMSLLVRDEADVIEKNIRYHAENGIDCFLVTDNNSVDGTREILEQLKQEYDLEIIDEPSRTFDQDLWVTRMAERLRDTQKADWVVNSDADEFWVSPRGDLKDEFAVSWQTKLKSFMGTPSPLDNLKVIECRRFNMLTSKDKADQNFFDFTLKVSRPLGLQKEAPDPSQKLDYHIMLRTIHNNVMCALEGFQRIGMGNHQAEHDKGASRISETIEVLHYPVRSYEQFERKVKNQGEGLTSNERFGERTGWHARRWYAMYQQGTLREEYESLFPDEAEASKLMSEGVVTKETVLQDYFHNQHKG